MSSRTSGPANRPTVTNTIAGVIAVPDSNLEHAATPSSVKATIASVHSMSSELEDLVHHRRDAGGDDNMGSVAGCGLQARPTLPSADLPCLLHSSTAKRSARPGSV